VEATLKRIARGIMRYVVNDPQPFIVPVTHHGDARVHAIDEPLRTITAAQRGEFALITPFIAKLRGTDRAHLDASASGIREPLRTISAGGTHHALCMAFIAKHYGDTGQRPGIALREPLSTITTVDHHALVTAFLIKFYGNERDGLSIAEPLHTITTKDRFGLVMVRGEPHRIVDIGMRMLTPRELYLAQGFPGHYIIDHGIDDTGEIVNMTKTAQVRMCGNSVSPYASRALVEANAIAQDRMEAA
jgi:DNA (cytosine-5)-methyltransferase 1